MPTNLTFGRHCSLTQFRPFTQPVRQILPAGVDVGAGYDIDSEALDDLAEQTIRHLYANWADEPIPMLGNVTPRQAMQTPAGLERAKGLIRSYESSEKEQTALQHRAPVSYASLWESIGLSA